MDFLVNSMDASCTRVVDQQTTIGLYELRTKCPHCPHTSNLNPVGTSQLTCKLIVSCYTYIRNLKMLLFFTSLSWPVRGSNGQLVTRLLEKAPYHQAH